MKKRGFCFLNKNTPQYVPPVDPNAMEINRLTAQEQADHMKKGLCFVCHQAGHRANDHGLDHPPGQEKHWHHMLHQRTPTQLSQKPEEHMPISRQSMEDCQMKKRRN